MGPYIFHDPIWLWALLLMPFAWAMRSRRRSRVLVVPNAATWFRPGVAVASRLPEAMAYLGIALLVVALARPQRLMDRVEEKQFGYDLVLVLDLSKSMWAEDYEVDGQRVNRISQLRPVVEAFVRSRPNDRIGIVVFSGRAYPASPLTHDHGYLQRLLPRLDVGLLENGTAMGDGLAMGIGILESARREDADVGSLGAFIILFCDGANNGGSMHPLESAAIAADKHVPVFTIGAGREGVVPFPSFDAEGNFLGLTPQQSDLDEKTLQVIAAMTGGEYFRADEAGTIQKAFEAIDRATKVEFQARTTYDAHELFALLAVPGAALLFCAFALLIAHGGTAAEVLQN